MGIRLNGRGWVENRGGDWNGMRMGMGLGLGLGTGTELGCGWGWG